MGESVIQLTMSLIPPTHWLHQGTQSDESTHLLVVATQTLLVAFSLPGKQVLLRQRLPPALCSRDLRELRLSADCRWLLLAGGRQANEYEQAQSAGEASGNAASCMELVDLEAAMHLWQAQGVQQEEEAQVKTKGLP